MKPPIIRIRKVVHFLLLSVLLYYVGKTIFVQAENINWKNIQPDYLFLALAIISDCISRIFAGTLYSSLLHRLNSQLPYKIALSISWLSLLGKYIPGKIAVIGSAMYLLSRYKVKPEITAIIPILANGMIIIMCLFLSLPLLFSVQGSDVLKFSKIWVLMILFIGFSAIHPKVFMGIINWILRLLKRPSIKNELTFKKMLIPFCVVFVLCISHGMTTWFMIHSMSYISYTEIPFVISISVLAGTLGFLAFFSPAGLGVREGIYLVMLSPRIGPEMAVLTTVCLRLLQTVVDIGMGIVGVGLLSMNEEITHA